MEQGKNQFPSGQATAQAHFRKGVLAKDCYKKREHKFWSNMTGIFAELKRKVKNPVGALTSRSFMHGRYVHWARELSAFIV